MLKLVCMEIIVANYRCCCRAVTWLGAIVKSNVRRNLFALVIDICRGLHQLYHLALYSSYHFHNPSHLESSYQLPRHCYSKGTRSGQGRID